MGRGSLQLDVRIPQVPDLADPPARVTGAPGVSALGPYVSFAYYQPGGPGHVVPFSKFEGLCVDIEEFIRGILALDGELRPLISDSKRTARDRELLQRVGGSLRACSTGGGP